MGGRPMPKPQASCTQTVADGMVVRTQLTSPVAEKAQRGNLEFLLINHPLDCPICDKGGECPLQNQTMANGAGGVPVARGEAGVRQADRRSPREILLDRERCVLCQRCTRFSDQIAGDPFIDLLERGVRAADRHRLGRAVPVLLLRQHHPDLPGRCADLAPPTGSGPGRSTWCPRRPSASTARRLRACAPTAGRNVVTAPAGRERPRRSTRSGTATRAGSPSPTSATDDRITRRWSAGADGVLAPASWTDGDVGRRRPVWPRPGTRRGRRAHRRPADRRRTPTPTRSSPDSPCAPTTSTSGPGAFGRGGGLPRRAGGRSTPDAGGVTFAGAGERRPRCCWSRSSPRTSPRSSSCGCARRPARGVPDRLGGGAGLPRAGQDRRCPAGRRRRVPKPPCCDGLAIPETDAVAAGLRRRPAR